MQQKLTKGVNMLFFNQVIGFECIYAMRDFQPIENQSCKQEEIIHFKF